MGPKDTTTFKLSGLTESELDDILKPIHLPEGGEISVQAHEFDLSLHLTRRGGKRDTPGFQEMKARIGKLLKHYIYTEGDETLEEIVGQLLRKRKWTLALAESCTGGYLSHRVTRVPGSSDYFITSAVTYSDAAKQIFLGVQKPTLEQHGAVSRETALEMAQGIKEQVGASITLSTTGIAGPTGGSTARPVGTVWMAMARGAGCQARCFHFDGDRETIIRGASQTALLWLREALL
jgi:nicotinamide-nucleotide amidase